MPDILRLSLPDDRITCDAGHSAQLDITVTNTAAESIPIGHRLSTERMTPTDWLCVIAPTDTQLGPGDTTSFTVTISPPEDATSRDHGFQLVFFDMDDPGERFVQTPLIEFDTVAYIPPQPVVYAPAPPPKPRRRSFFAASAGILFGVVVSFVSLVAFIIGLLTLETGVGVFLFLIGGTLPLVHGIRIGLRYGRASQRFFPTSSLVIAFQLVTVGSALVWSLHPVAASLGVLLLIWASYNYRSNWRMTEHTYPGEPAAQLRDAKTGKAEPTKSSGTG